jgi:hypothetical protein
VRGWFSTYRSILLLLILFAVAATMQSRLFPTLEGSDEPLHIAYAAHLRTDGKLPDRTTYLANCARQQSGQPPLVYATGALLLDLLRVPAPSCDDVFTYAFEERANAWLLSPDPYRRDDNNTNFLPMTTVTPPEGFPGAVYALRLVSVVFGTLAVFGAWLAAGEVLRDRAWRTTATVVFAFTPTFFHLSAYFTNDTAAIAFATLVIWRALVAVRQETGPWAAFAVGLFIGLGGLAKVSVLLTAPVFVFAIFWRWLRTPGARHIGAFVVPSALATAGALVMFGPWMGYGLLTYGDPFGTGTHIHPTLNYDPPLGLFAIIGGLPDVARTYAGLLGYANVYLPSAAYGVMGVLVLVALVGWRGGRPGGSPLHVWQAWVLALAFVLMFAGFLRFYRVIFAVTGRLLLPAHVAVVVGLVAGLQRLRGRRVWQTVAVSIVVLCGVGYTGSSLYAAYAPRPVDNLPPLAGPAYTFDDTIRLLGYHTATTTLTTNIHEMTLCWEVLRPTERLAAYAVRYVKDGVPTAQRTTIHGLGRYNSTLWEPGTRFCDTLDMPVGDARFGAVPPEPGACYDVLVVLLDARTGDVNWTATTDDGTVVPFPVLGRVNVGN